MDKPHDKLFHVIFRQAGPAASLLRCVLPRALAQRIDWRSLRREDTKLASAAAERQADLLFSARLRGRKRGERVFLLLEHKSEAEADTAFRVLRFMMSLWQALRDDRAGRVAQRLWLPRIEPVLVHHSLHGRRVGTSLRGLFRPAIGGVAPAVELGLHLLDLAGESAASLQARRLVPLASLGLLLLARARRPGFVEELRAATRLLRGVFPHAGDESREMVARYIMEIGGVEPMVMRDILAAGAGRAAEEDWMKTYPKFLREIKAEGKAEGKAELLERLLEARFGRLASAARSRLLDASEEDLDRWAGRILAAATVDEVFGAG